jgi:multidrug efflux pump subunit AcrA (membrane-fusion protein)
MRTHVWIKKKRAAAAVCLAVTMLASCGTAEQQVPELIEPVSPGIGTAEVTTQTVYEISYYESSVIPELTELSFPESGTIEEISAYIGMEVTEGQMLAALMGASEEYERLSTQLEEQQESDEYNNTLADLKLAQAKLQNKLYDAGIDTTRQKLLNDQQKALQELDEQYTKDCLSRLLSHLSDAYLSAPSDGVVAAMADVRKGSYVTEDTPVLAIADSDTQYVMCDYISETTINRCDRIYAMIGDSEYELEYIPIDQTELSAIRLQGETAYSTFRVVDGDASLVGKYAVICMVKNTREDVTAVPLTALFSDSDGEYVYRMDGESRVKTRVTIGVKGAHYVEIADGLLAGDTVYVQESAVPGYSETMTLEYQDFTVTASAGVSVYYPEQTSVTYESDYGNAQFVEWLVLVGDEVTEGQPIMTITVPVDEIAVTELELKTERLANEKADIESDNKAAVKAKKSEISAASGDEKALLENELKQMELTGEQQLNDAEERLNDAKEELAAAYAAREQTEVLAPCDGTILSLESYRKDDVISPDTSVGIICNKAEALYDFKDSTSVMRYGESVTLKDMRGTEFSGVMVSCSALGLTESLQGENAVLKCLDELEEAKRYGLEVQYNVVDLEHVLVVPTSAVYTDTYGTYVIELYGDSTRRRYFTPGKTANGKYLVIDGLEAGIVLVTE